MESSAPSPEQRPFPCQLCNKCFAAKETLEEHLAKCTEAVGRDDRCSASEEVERTKKFRCPECPYSTDKKGHLEQHGRTHTGERPYSCGTCNKSFAQKSTLTSHVNMHTGEQPYACDACGRRFVHRNSLRHHKRRHLCTLVEGEVANKCKASNEHSKENREILSTKPEDHLSTRSVERPHCCEICNKVFTRKSVLQTHLRNHTGERPLDCDAGFSSRSDSHQITHLPSKEEQRYCCTECPYSTSASWRFQRHLSRHSAKPPHCCEFCNKAFPQKSVLQIHLRKHTGERPYVCDTCGKGFFYKGSLDYHQKTHLPKPSREEQRYCCTECPYSTSARGHLKRHLLVHSGERPHCCVICNKAYARKCALMEHLRVHTGERPYVCDTCGKRFLANSYLTRHLKMHHSSDDKGGDKFVILLQFTPVAVPDTEPKANPDT